MDMVEKIVIARDYYVSKWLFPSLHEYARLERPISVEDVDRLGFEYVLEIVQTRQHYRVINSGSTTYPCSHCTDRRSVYSEIRYMWETDCTDALRIVFKDKLEGAQKTWSMNKTSTDPPVYVTTKTESI
jgi:hypothetical protein